MNCSHKALFVLHSVHQTLNIRKGRFPLHVATVVRPVSKRRSWAMAESFGNLWEYNFCRVIVVDVSDDYRLMQPPMPSDYYPVLREVWLPRFRLSKKLSKENLVTGYLYDWHQTPAFECGSWYVGVVEEQLTKAPKEFFPQSA